MRVEIPQKRYFKIGEVSQLTGVEAHTIRYWESEFRQLKPRRAGSRQRLYRRDDVKMIDTIRILLHDEKYTIAGAKRRLKKGPGQEAGRAKAPTKASQAQTGPVEAKSNADIKAKASQAQVPKPDPVSRPEPAVAGSKAKKDGEDQHPVLFPGLNRNGINSAGASILIRVKSELKEILELLN